MEVSSGRRVTEAWGMVFHRVGNHPGWIRHFFFTGPAPSSADRSERTSVRPAGCLRASRSPRSIEGETTIERGWDDGEPTRKSMISIFSLYLRCIRESFRRWNERGLEVVWQFSMGSVAGIVFAFLSTANAFSGEAIVPSLLAAAGCLGLSAVTGAYVMHAVQKAAIEDNGDADSLD